MYEIFLKLLEKHHTTAYKVGKATGIGASTFSDWKSGRSNPKKEKLEKIADYFGVSIEYLMTGEDSSKELSTNELSNVYFSLAKEAEQNGIDPDDIRLALDTIKRLRGGNNK